MLFKREKMLPWGNKLEIFLQSYRTNVVFGFVIVLNAIILGLETSKTFMTSYGPILSCLDKLFLSIFILDLTLRIISRGPRFFKNGWNLFDTGIILIALLPFFTEFTSLRPIRILWIMRLITLFPNMKRVVSAVIRAIPGIISVAGMLLLFFYIAAIIAFNLFSKEHPDYFGSLDGSMYTLFQLILCDDWGVITRPVLQTHPHAYLFFIPLMVVMTFIVLNLFFGLIVSAMQGEAEATSIEQLNSAQTSNQNKEIALELTEIKQQIAHLTSLLDKKT